MWQTAGGKEGVNNPLSFVPLSHARPEGGRCPTYLGSASLPSRETLCIYPRSCDLALGALKPRAARMHERARREISAEYWPDPLTTDDENESHSRVELPLERSVKRDAGTTFSHSPTAGGDLFFERVPVFPPSPSPRSSLHLPESILDGCVVPLFPGRRVPLSPQQLTRQKIGLCRATEHSHPSLHFLPPPFPPSLVSCLADTHAEGIKKFRAIRRSPSLWGWNEQTIQEKCGEILGFVFLLDQHQR